MTGNRGSYRMIRKRMVVLLLALLSIVLLLAGCALRARMLLGFVLDGRLNVAAEEPEQDAYSGFRLREQMNSAQEAVRVNGWLTIADVQPVELRTQRGTLRASLYSAIGGEADAPYAVVLHGGEGSDHMQVQDLACELSLNGYHVLTPDTFAHGKSDGRYTSLGLCEAQDLRAWIDWIRLKEASARIVVIGISEGAAAALISMGEGMPESVRAVVLDSAYLSVEQYALARLQARLGKVTGGDWALFKLAYRLLFGADLRECDLLHDAANADRPIMFIHGTGDQLTPAWHSEDLAQATGENAHLMLIEGASHVMARFADPQLYYDTLFSFLSEALM